MGSKFRANSYIARNSGTVVQRYRHSYHVMPEIGWCNDPNGFAYYDGKIHLFYQYNPYSAGWDTMHWGHVTSRDFIKWEYQPVALAPDMPYDDCGCFSGSAIEKDGMLYLMYTGVNAEGLQQQCLAFASDGVSFEKPFVEPVITKENVGPEMSIQDFRDPYVFRMGGYYYSIMGTKAQDYGNIALYRSKDLINWQFQGYCMNGTDPKDDNYYRLNAVYECPCFAEVDGKQILICSPQFLPQEGCRFQNVHSVVYMVGRLDLESGRFHYDKFEEVDSGFDFYAAQTTTMPDGRVVLSAWMQMWDRNLPSQPDGWAGAMVLPRELHYKNGRLYQTPVREIENYRLNRVERKDIALGGDLVRIEGIAGDTLELITEFETGNAERVGIKLFEGKEHETLLYYDCKKGEVVLDRSCSGVPLAGVEENNATRSVEVPVTDGKITLRVFLDNTSIEAFVNDGYAVLTANVYADEEDEGISFFAAGGTAKLNRVTKYDIVVK